MEEKRKELVTELAEECRTLKDVQSLLKGLFKETIEQMLQAEMDEHLGYEKSDSAGNNSGNSRNGYGKKTVKSELGETEIQVPRDRNGEFEPRVLPKRQTRTDDLESRILAMYSKGMTNRNIEDHLREVYGVDASASLISRITDKIMPEITQWQNRQLEVVNPIVFLDGIIFKVRKESRVQQMPVLCTWDQPGGKEGDTGDLADGERERECVDGGAQ